MKSSEICFRKSCFHLLFSDLERKFQLEPVSTDLAVGKRLVLTCIPPKGKPDPEVSPIWEFFRCTICTFTMLWPKNSCSTVLLVTNHWMPKVHLIDTLPVLIFTVHPFKFKVTRPVLTCIFVTVYTRVWMAHGFRSQHLSPESKVTGYSIDLQKIGSLYVQCQWQDEVACILFPPTLFGNSPRF